MNANRRFTWLMSAAAFMSLLSGCMGMQPLVTQPTLDLTKAPFNASTELSEAPFRASSELTDGTSQAATDLTEPTKNFTSSTSPRSWFAADGTLKAEYKVMTFTVLKYDNVKENDEQWHSRYIATMTAL